MRGSSDNNKKNSDDSLTADFETLNDLYADVKGGKIVNKSDYEQLLIDVANKYDELLKDRKNQLLTPSLFVKKARALEGILIQVMYDRKVALDNLHSSLETLSYSIKAGRKQLNQIPSAMRERAALDNEIDRAIKLFDHDRFLLRKAQIDLDNDKIATSRSQVESEYQAKIETLTNVIDWLKNQKKLLEENPSENYLRIKKTIEAGKPTIQTIAIRETSSEAARERFDVVSGNASTLRRESLFSKRDEGKEGSKKPKRPLAEAPSSSSPTTNPSRKRPNNK